MDCALNWHLRQIERLRAADLPGKRATGRAVGERTGREGLEGLARPMLDRTSDCLSSDGTDCIAESGAREKQTQRSSCLAWRGNGNGWVAEGDSESRRKAVLRVEALLAMLGPCRTLAELGKNRDRSTMNYTA